MRRFRCSLALVFSLAGLVLLSRGEAQPTAASAAFEGVWIGEITGPNARTPLGLAFTPTPHGLLVSVQMPEMFLHSVNFGPAEIQDGTFTLAPLHLRVSRRDDILVGTFAPVRMPVKLRRGDSFPPAPPEPDYPVAPAPRWTRSLGAPVWASPVVHGGVVYVPVSDGKFHAVRAADGVELWTWTGPHPLYGEPLVTETALYFVDDRCDLVALSRTQGALLWRLPLHDETFAPRPAGDPTFNHRTATPVTDNRGTLYVGSTDGGLYAVRLSSGKAIWRHPAKAPIYAPVALNRDELVAATFDGSVFTLNRRSRRETHRTQLGGAVVSAPVIASDRILVGSRDYQLYTLASNGAVIRSNSYWFSWVESTPRVVDGVIYIGGSDYRRVSALDLATGSARWATDVRGLSWGSPLVTPDTVFAGTAGQTLEGTVIKHIGGLLALDRATGAVRWHHRSTPAPGAAFTGFAGSLALAGDLVIGASVDGTLVALPSGATPATPPARR
jgi:outer membrane protein assembly factor BamB